MVEQKAKTKDKDTIEGPLRKKYIPQSVYLTDRDIDIFRILSSGPTAIGHLQRQLQFFRSQHTYEDKDDSKDLNRKNEKNTSEKHLLVIRLSKLKKFGYIESRRYGDRTGKNGVYSLYTLTMHSKQVLVDDYKYDPTYIRMGLPHMYGVSHELLVTDVVRTIKREAGKLKYDFSLKDENTLRSESNKKGERFPDLLVELRIPDNRGKNTLKELAIEVDNSTHPPLNVFEKAKVLFGQYGISIMILCNDRPRINKLIETFAPLADSKMTDRIYIAFSQEFSDKGFANTKWARIDNKYSCVIVNK